MNVDELPEFFRNGNIKLFLAFDGDNNLKRSARIAEVDYSHARRLAQTWRTQGLLEKISKSGGSRFIYTKTGMEVLFTLQELISTVGEIDER